MQRQPVITALLHGWVFPSSIPFRSRLWQKSCALVHPEHNTFHPLCNLHQTTGKIPFTSPIRHFRTFLPTQDDGWLVVLQHLGSSSIDPAPKFWSDRRSWPMDNCATLTEVRESCKNTHVGDVLKCSCCFWMKYLSVFPIPLKSQMLSSPKPHLVFYIQALSPTTKFGCVHH